VTGTPGFYGDDTLAPFEFEGHTVATSSPRTQSNSVTKAPIRSVDVDPAITEDGTEAPFEYIVNTDSPKRAAPPSYTPPAYTPPSSYTDTDYDTPPTGYGTPPSSGYGNLFPPPTTTTRTPPAYTPPTTTGYGNLFPPPTTTTRTPPAYTPPTTTGYGNLFPPPTTTTRTPPATSTGYGSPPSAYGR
jgi:hypothetical protein